MTRQIKNIKTIFAISGLFLMLFSGVLLIEFGIIAFIFLFFITIFFIKGALSSGWMRNEPITRQPVRGANISGVGLVGKHSTASMTTRLVMNPIDETQYPITGRLEMTFREACLFNWPFPNISISDEWMVTDDSGKDISDVLLKHFDGIAWIKVKKRL
ncbi:MAG: hypothetical protein GF411_20155 [Candidatus Lokiarchaeota archaeon]|nr:hypothetical protein [Candidatus Lokiarchaeota archaeon]